MAIGSTVDLPTIRQRIEVDGSGLDRMKGKLGGLGKTLGLGVAAGAGIAAAGLGVFVAKGVSGAVEVERGVREVVTLFGETGEAADAMTSQLTKGVADLSNELGIAQTEITGGLYAAISAGVPRDNAFDFMEVASRAAVAGVTDVETSVDGLSTVINAFGLDADDAAAVADSMFAAVQGGKTTFEELSASMFNVAPAAAGLGIGFEDVNAAIATLTASGTPTSVATTQMRAALSELGKSGSKAATAFEEISGTTFPEFIAAGGSLDEALAMMGDAAGGSATELSNMFGSVEAGAAAAQLGITNASKFSDELERQAGAAGATDDAFGTMEEGVGRKMEKIKTQLTNVATAVGTVILPMISDAIDKIAPAFERAARVIGPIIETLVSGDLGSLLEAFGLTGDKAGEITGFVGEVFADMKTWIGEIMVELREIFAGVIEVATTLWSMFGDDVMRFVRESFSAIRRIIGGVLRVVKGIIETVLGIITGDWSRAWEGVKSIVSGVWQAIRGIIDLAISRVRFIINVALGLIKGAFGGAWNAVVRGVSGFYSRMVGYFERLRSSIRSKIDSAVSFVRSIPSKILSAIGNVGSLLYNAGRNIIQGLINGITSKISAIRSKISSVASTVRRFLPFSPAKEGPLSGSGSPDRAGAKIGSMVADGIEDSKSAVANAASRLAASASMPLPSALGMSVDAQGSPGAAAGRAGISQTFHVRAFDPVDAARKLGETQVRAMHLVPGGV